jgi:feruloyl esterase
MKKTIAPLLLLAAASAQAAEPDACARLAKVTLPDATISLAETQGAGEFDSAFGRLTGLPAFCRVVGVATPTPQSQIGFEVWLPQENWRKRYVQVGNGGLAGVIFHPLMAQMLERGYATAGTDNGHKGIPIDGSWAIGAPEKVRDFAERAVHVTRGLADRIVAEYYGARPEYDYFFGCSEGGREALIEAQRFPDDFDGIVAGAPAADWTGLLTGFVWTSQALHKDPASFIPESKLPLIQNAALAACDATDGVKDGLVSNPAQCRFEPKALACGEGSQGECLTQPQVVALEKLYAGLRHPQSGEVIAPGYVPSGESELSAMGGGVRQYAFGAAPGKSLQVAFATGFFGGFVYERPDWDFRTFDFTRDYEHTRNKLGALMDATNPDLSAFRKRGGKLIQYHGLLDGSIPPAMSTRYYDQVSARMGVETRDFYRLFLAPGVLHCGFGPGPHIFGNLGPRGPADADHDTLLALERWVEQGVAPGSIIATKYVDDDPKKGVALTRPLCVYPQMAQWNGRGDANDHRSFECR